MQTLEDVLELVTMAREHIERGLTDDARWMLELVEGDLAELAGNAECSNLPKGCGRYRISAWTDSTD